MVTNIPGRGPAAVRTYRLGAENLRFPVKANSRSPTIRSELLGGCDSGNAGAVAMMSRVEVPRREQPEGEGQAGDHVPRTRRSRHRLCKLDGRLRPVGHCGLFSRSTRGGRGYRGRVLDTTPNRSFPALLKPLPGRCRQRGGWTFPGASRYAQSLPVREPPRVSTTRARATVGASVHDHPGVNSLGSAERAGCTRGAKNCRCGRR